MMEFTRPKDIFLKPNSESMKEDITRLIGYCVSLGWTNRTMPSAHCSELANYFLERMLGYESGPMTKSHAEKILAAVELGAVFKEKERGNFVVANPMDKKWCLISVDRGVRWTCPVKMGGPFSADSDKRGLFISPGEDINMELADWEIVEKGGS